MNDSHDGNALKKKKKNSSEEINFDATVLLEFPQKNAKVKRIVQNLQN